MGGRCRGYWGACLRIRRLVTSVPWWRAHRLGLALGAGEAAAVSTSTIQIVAPPRRYQGCPGGHLDAWCGDQKGTDASSSTSVHQNGGTVAMHDDTVDRTTTARTAAAWSAASPGPSCICATRGSWFGQHSRPSGRRWMRRFTSIAAHSGTTKIYLHINTEPCLPRTRSGWFQGRVRTIT